MGKVLTGFQRERGEELKIRDRELNRARQRKKKICRGLPGREGEFKNGDSKMDREGRRKERRNRQCCREEGT